MLTASCATYKKTSGVSSMYTYSEALNFLSTSLVSEITDLGEEKKCIIIYNANVVNGEETKLEQRFIQDLENNLANLNIQIKRKEIFNRDITKNNALRIDCSQNIIKTESNLIIEIRIDECIHGTNCADASVRVIDRITNTIKFAEKKSFELHERLARWNNDIVTLKTIRGTRENPYRDFREAAMHIFGKIVCIAKAMIKNDDLLIFIKGTEETPEDLIVSFSQSTSQYGVRQVLVKEKWLDVALGARDHFQMVIYDRTHQDLFRNTGMVLGVYLKNINYKLSEIGVQLMTIDQISVTLDGVKKNINAGEAIPLCAATGYVMAAEKGEIISAIGTGICSKQYFKSGMWESTARDAARIKAKSLLVEKVKNYIKGSKTTIDGQLTRETIELSVQASISNARLIWEKFDPETCVAKAKYEVFVKNVVIHSSNNINSNVQSYRSQNYYINKRKNNQSKYSNNDTFFSNRPVLQQSSSVQRSYKRAQKNTIRFVQSDLRKRLHKDDIDTRTINMIDIIGSIDLPKCRQDDNYQASSHIPRRFFCTVNYDLNLKIGEKIFFKTHDQAQGLGPEKGIAWEDALLAISKKLYPLINDIALVLSERMELETFKSTLKVLDEWNFNSGYNIDSLFAEIQRMINNF